MEISGDYPTHYLRGNDSVPLNLTTSGFWLPVLSLPVHCSKPSRYLNISCLSF